ncbi:MAG: alpha/beta fold hydrolase [Bacillota bacterium]
MFTEWGEHSGRYEHVASFFNEKGFSCIAFDLRGHGMSGGKRGHAKSYEAIMRDVDTLFEESPLGRACRAIVLYGHSLGGNIVLNYALRGTPMWQA